MPSDTLQTHFSGLPNSGRCLNFWLCSHLSVQQSDLYKAAMVMCNPFSGHGSDATLRQRGLEGSYFARPKSERVCQQCPKIYRGTYLLVFINRERRLLSKAKKIKNNNNNNTLFTGHCSVLVHIRFPFSCSHNRIISSSSLKWVFISKTEEQISHMLSGLHARPYLVFMQHPEAWWNCFLL